MTACLPENENISVTTGIISKGLGGKIKEVLISKNEMLNNKKQ